MKLKSFDVIVIGAGVAGAAVAREMTKYALSVAVLEKNAEVACEVTKGTHAIVHAGLSVNPLTPLKNRGELMGAAMMGQLCADLDVKYQRIGKLLVAFDETQVAQLKALMQSAKRLGLMDIELIEDRSRLLEMEPNLNPDVIAALHTPNTGIVSPWGLVYGLLENAQDNGASVFVECAVTGIRWDAEAQRFLLDTRQGPFSAKYVVNAAGPFSDKVAAMVGDTSFQISLTRQEKVIFDKNYQGAVRHVVRMLNNMGAPGDFICPTVYGDLMAGVEVKPTDDFDACHTTQPGIEEHVLRSSARLIPTIPASAVIRPFSGVLNQCAGTGEFVIRSAPQLPRFLNFVLGGSGLTACYAMAQYLSLEVFPTVADAADLKTRGDFNPCRKDMPHVHDLEPEELAELIARDPRYGHVICRCETVTEGEIVEAIRRGARSVDGVKFRTRAGMGRCQGGFCGPRVIAILSRELQIPPEAVTKKGPGSYMVTALRDDHSVKGEAEHV